MQRPFLPCVRAACVSFSILTATVGAQLPTVPPGLDVTAATSNPALHDNTINVAIATFGLSSEMLFAPSGRFDQDREAGTARLTGRVVDRYDTSKAFDIDVTFTGLTGVAPAGSPKKELRTTAYVENGGPVDPSTWYYYTSFSGTFTGADAWAGGNLTVTPRGPALQIGAGANGTNGLYGFSSWFFYTVDSSPPGQSWTDGTGDFNVNLQGDCVCAEGSPPDPAYSLNPGTGALAVGAAFGCDTQWDLVSEAVFDVDIAAGTARIAGELVAQNDPNCRLCFEIVLSSRVAPGDASYPPSGSPYLAAVQPAGLYANGGAIDPEQWIYYRTMSGTLLGKGSLAGAQVSLSDHASGIAGQFGSGTARNTELGFYAPVRLTVDAQPTSGPALSAADAEVWLELGNCSRPVFMPQGVSPIPSLPRVTNGCYELTGCSLDTITQVQFGPHTITSQDPCDFGDGYFTIVDANTLTFCPPLCLDPAVLPFHAVDGTGAASDAVSLQLVDPSGPTVACATDLDVGCEQSVYLYGGPASSYHFCLIASPVAQPSVLPGIVSLSLGANFSLFAGIDGVHPNCFELVLGTVPSRVAGYTLYFQAIVMDPQNIQLPLPTSNMCATAYHL